MAAIENPVQPAAYNLLRAALTLFKKSPDELAEAELQQAKKQALNEFRIESRVLDTPEASAVIITEQELQQAYQEIPYSTAVTIESFKEKPEKNLVVIQGTIHLERDSQKKILIGRGGQKLKDIGEAARKEIEAFLGTRVYLELWVNVQDNWTRDPRALDRLGYR